MATPSRIAFGSCNDQDRTNLLWSVIGRRKPAAFIWGGDAIYADYHVPLDWSHFPKVSRLQCADPAQLRKLYKKQKRVAGYRHLLQSNVTVFGTFDDHDYGCNNADRTYEFRYESGIEYVNFLGQPLDSPMSRRAHAGLGVYGVKLFDFDRAHGYAEVPDDEANIDPDVSLEGYEDVSPVQTYSNRSVAVFVLDIRSNKSPWKQGSEAYLPDYEGDFLGEHQWKWFEAAIRRSKAAVNVVISGVQVHPNVFPNGDIAESWSKYPRAQQRLYDALLEDGVQAPILVSGDVHMNQMMRKECKRADGSAPRRPLFEMTTSGMTHSWGELSSPPISYPEQRPSLWERYESFVASTVMHFMHMASPWTALMLSETPDTPNGRSYRKSRRPV